MSPAIVAEGLTRRYGDFAAVRGLDLSVEPGTIFGLLGTNGAGKTSTMEVLEGLAAPSSGSVRVLGHDPHRHRSRVAQQIGVMLQEGGLPQDLTVAEAARMWAGTLARPRPVVEALEMVDMSDRAARRISALSGGERRRLDLALTLMNRPRVVFLDEPTTGLDPESRAAAWRIIANLRDAGAAVVLTTHYLDEAESLSDHLVIMHRGEIARAGTVGEIIADHPGTIRLDESVLDRIRELPGPPSGWRSDRGRILTETADLQGDLHRLLDAAAHRGITLAGLDARAASLEQVFLAIAGEDRNGDSR